jgi:hypothetical protein
VSISDPDEPLALCVAAADSQGYLPHISELRLDRCGAAEQQQWPSTSPSTLALVASVRSFSPPVIHHVFQTRYCSGGRRLFGTKTGGSPGFGDFLRGSAALWEICAQRGIRLELCVENHIGMRSLLESGRGTHHLPMHGDDTPFIPWGNTYSSIDTMKGYIDGLLARGERRLTFCTNLFAAGWQQYSLAPACRAFFVDALRPTPRLQAAYESASRDIHAGGDYDVVHVRCGDPVGSRNVPESHRAQVEAILREHIRPGAEHRVVVISDNTELRAHLSSACGLLTLGPSRICHLADGGPDGAACDTMVDFLLMSHAKVIWQISVHWWGSGFSESCAHIHDIPIRRFVLH